MTPLERAEGYRVLAIALRHPGAPGELAEALAETAGAGGAIGALASALAARADGDLDGAYNATFAQNTPCSPYETSYVMGDKGARIGQIASLYAAFGVRVGGAEREAPDHVGVELEFAALLALKEALVLEEGNEERVALVRRARQVFLEEHLGAWAPRFAARLAELAPHPFYAEAAAALDGFVAADLADQGWHAARVALGLPLFADPNEMVCEGVG